MLAPRSLQTRARGSSLLRMMPAFRCSPFQARQRWQQQFQCLASPETTSIFSASFPGRADSGLHSSRQRASNAAVLVFFESPNRLGATLSELSTMLGDPRGGRLP